MEEPPIVELDRDKEWHCGCVRGGSGGLEVLREVQRAYEDRLEALERDGGRDKIQLQAELLRSWVADLVGQNSLLASAVQQLEVDATARLRERRRYNEMLLELRTELASLRRSLARKESDKRNLLKLFQACRDKNICLDGLHFFDVTESDIFGPVEGPQKDQNRIDQAMLMKLLEQEFKKCHAKFLNIV